MTRISALVCAAGAAALCLSCGPSLRRTYQSDNAFSLCFDMDYNPGVAAADKQACWQGWLDHRVYNQPDDKARYARLRLEELARGISIPGPPGPDGAFDQRPQPKRVPHAPSAASPTGAPGDGDAPRRTLASSAEEPAEGAGGPPPGSACEAGCKTSRVSCMDACAGDAGVDERCPNACDAGYRSCMKACFSE